MKIMIYKMKIIKLAIKLSAIASLLFLTNTGNAALSCKDVKYGNDNYFDNMEKLAIEARLPGGYFHRYHESVVSDLCNKKDNKDIEWLIKTGYTARSEVQSIKEVLGLDTQYLKGVRYQSIINKFSDMGIASAYAGNATHSYIYNPESKCGKLAKNALQGNTRSIKILQTGPSYCQSGIP